MRTVNRMSLFLWAFTAVWFCLLLAFTWLMSRDGPPPGYAPELGWGVLALFWVAGLGLAGFAASRPCQTVTLDAGGAAHVTWAYPHRRVRKTYPAGSFPAPVVLETRDDEGNPYFRARLSLPDGHIVDLAEGHDRARCEEVCARFSNAPA